MTILTDGFDFPVGSPVERRRTELPKNWIVTNAFGRFYQVVPGRDALHTGVDMVYWPGGGAHSPIYCIGNGTVTCARTLEATWGNVVCVQHITPQGTSVFSRYAHVENMQVKEGQQVLRGTWLAGEGNANGQFPYHLHFDISPGGLLGRSPGDWPGTDKQRLIAGYTDPLIYIRGNRPMNKVDILSTIKALAQQINTLAEQLDVTDQPQPDAREPLGTNPTLRVASMGLNVRTSPLLGDNIKTQLHAGDAVWVVKDVTANDIQWAKITQGDNTDCFVAAQYLD